MQLLRLKGRLALAYRGHKLLKDKLDGLVQRFFGIKKEYLDLYHKMEPELIQIFTQSVLSSALSHPKVMEDLASSNKTAIVSASAKNIMGVKIPEYTLKFEGEEAKSSRLLASSEFFHSRKAFAGLLPELIKMAALSRALQLMAREIIETRRRVNALEYVLIPELERNLKLIRMKLSELERGAQVTLLKIKDIVRAH